MNLFKSSLYVSAIALLSMLCACSSESGKSTNGYLVYTTQASTVPSLEVLQSMCIPSAKLIMSDKGLSVSFSGVEHDEVGNYIAMVSINSWSGDGQNYVEKTIKTGATTKLGGEVKLVDISGTMDITNTYTVPESDFAALWGDSNLGNMHFVFVESDSILNITQSMIENPQFAAVKEFIDSYQSIAKATPIAAAQAKEVETEAAEEQAVETQKYVLTKEGFKGVLTVGMKISDIPAKVEGLYDSFKQTKEFNEMEEMDVTVIKFYSGNENIMTAYSFESGTLDNLEIFSKDIPAGEGNNPLHVGDKIKGLKYNPDYGYYEKDGVKINPEVNGTIFSMCVGETL